MPRLAWTWLAISFAAFAAGSCARDENLPAESVLKPCAVEQGPTDAYCTTLEVPENRTTGAGRKIALQVVVLRALKPRAEGSPLFVLAGGPGEAAAQSAAQAQLLFRPVQKTRDVVLVDQRGTGKSNGLDCAEDSVPEDTSIDAVSRARACLARAQLHADVRQYTTANAVDDLESVRRYLGYGKVNLYGVSYGTRPAMLYAQRYAATTRSVILDSVAPVAMKQPLNVPRDSQDALDVLARDCERSVPCASAYPGLHDRIERLLASLDAAPERIEYRDPTTGLASSRVVDRKTVAASLLIALYASDSSALIPVLVAQAEHRDFAGFLAVMAASRAATAKVAQGAFLSVMCSEDAPNIGRESILAATANTFLGPRPVKDRLEACDAWPKSESAPAVDAVASNIPALLFSGELDPVTPPSWGDYVARRSGNARPVVVPGTGHSTINYGCVPELIGRFLDDPDPARLDVSCLQALHRPRFFVSPSGPQEAVR